MIDRLKDLVKISNAVGNRIDYVQGGGGNTSVKIDDNTMAIKASGFLLKDVTVDKAFALCDYKKIRAFYSGKNMNDKDIITESTLLVDGLKGFKPSIETGFHSMLGRNVIHTHSVYANVITCAKNVAKQIKTYCTGEVYFLDVPYGMPGQDITSKIVEVLNGNGIDVELDKPVCMFLKNHGFVVSATTADLAIKTHEKINEYLKKKFGAMNTHYEVIREDNKYCVDTKIFDESVLATLLSNQIMNKVLFPDQIVYIQTKDSQRKIMKKEDGQLKFETNIKEAQAIIDTLLSYTYIVKTAHRLGIELEYISRAEVNRLMENEHEDYRKKIMMENK